VIVRYISIFEGPGRRARGTTTSHLRTDRVGVESGQDLGKKYAVIVYIG